MELNEKRIELEKEWLKPFNEFKVVATKEKLIALGDWMYENEIYFEKLENETA